MGRTRDIDISPKTKRKIEDIKNDREHGANYLAIEALNVLKFGVEDTKEKDVPVFSSYLKQIGKELMEVRPSMAVITNVVNMVIYTLVKESKKTTNLKILKGILTKSINELIKDLENSIFRIAAHGKKLIKDKSTIMTHSWSRTFIEIMRNAREKVKGVIVLEGRPLFEGRKTAKELLELGILVTLITDAQAGYFMSDVDLVLVGADSILPNGSVVNKVGTYLLALSARDKGIPFYAACSSYKIRSDEELELEEKEGKEVMEEPLPNLKVRNVYFDITPPELIVGIITEKGVLKPNEVINYLNV
ncbi:MAG: translation initiation factor eIF-2B [bacterium]|nr:translation initiation factor eIF-2B [bacterium]